MKCNILGAGRLGKNLALALSHAGLASIEAVYNQSIESAEQSCREIGCGFAVSSLANLPKADLIWICSNDDSISGLVKQLLAQSTLKPGCFVLHCSGVLNSSVLRPLKTLGCFIGSFHPLKTFPTGYLDATAFLGVDCVYEGDKAIGSWLTPSFEQLQACITTIKPRAKAQYHAAACMAANYLITLADCSETLLLSTGIDPEICRKMLHRCMQSSLNKLQSSKSNADCLTGPLVRGDVGTLALHLQAIEAPLIRQLYQSAGLATLALTPLSKEKKQVIEALLLS